MPVSMPVCECVCYIDSFTIPQEARVNTERRRDIGTETRRIYSGARLCFALLIGHRMDSVKMGGTSSGQTHMPCLRTCLRGKYIFDTKITGQGLLQH